MNALPSALKAETEVEAERQSAAETIASLLVTLGLVTTEQCAVLLGEGGEASPRTIVQGAVEHGYLDSATAAALDGGEAPVRLEPRPLVDPVALKLIPADLAQQYGAVAVFADAGTVTLATTQRLTREAVTALRPYLPAGARVEPRMWPKSEFAETVHEISRRPSQPASILKELERGAASAGGWVDAGVRLANVILLEAIKHGATALHVDQDTALRVSLRIDGAVQPLLAMDRQHWPVLRRGLAHWADQGKDTTRNADRLRFQLGGRRIEGHLTLVRTRSGDCAVLHLVETGKVLVPLERLGLSEPIKARIRTAVERPSGLFLVAGPHASGRTTTLYALLAQMKHPQLAVAAVERRCEYALAGVRQIAVGPDSRAMADGIRLAAEQDADIILVESIDDGMTAEAALAAAISGRRVLATIHASDAAAALSRLYTLGLSPTLIGTNLALVVAQRLGRRLCPVCKESRPATPHDLRLLGRPDANLSVCAPVGCPYCRNSGFRGRLVIAEALTVDADIEDMIACGATRSEILGLAEERGYRSLADDGTDRVAAGELSPEELLRAVDMTARL